VPHPKPGAQSLQKKNQWLAAGVQMLVMSRIRHAAIVP
jgi:hypothetical protein